MPAARNHLIPSPALTRRGLLVLAGTVAVVQLAGCTVEMEDSSNSTGGSGGTSSVAGADGGAPAASAPAPDAGSADATAPARR
jgi:hypothetical protein